MRQVIDGIGTVKRHPKARSKLLPRGTRKREMSKRLKGCLDRADKARRDLLRRLGRQRGPDFGQISQAAIDVRLERGELLELERTFGLPIAQRLTHHLTARCIVAALDRALDDGGQ